MNEIIVLVFVTLFGDGEITTLSPQQASMEICERNVAILWDQEDETYRESNVVSMDAKCVRMTLNRVPGADNGALRP